MEYNLDEMNELLDSLRHSSDELMHYGVGPDDDPPGRGSGRYAKGTGANPYQHDPAMRKKKMGLFARVGSRIKKFKEDREEAKRIQKEWDEEQYRLAEEGRKKQKRLEALQKARETKAANKVKAEEERKTQEAHDEEKRKAIASGDPEQISKFLSELSNQEQFDAINRIRQTQSINDAAKAQAKAREDARRAEEERIAAEKKAIEEANRPKTKEELKAEKAAKRKEKFDNFMNKSKEILDQGSRVRDLAEKGIDIWNTIATINNAFNDDHQMTLIKRPDQIWKEKASERQEQLKWEREQEKKKAENQENKNQNNSNQNSDPKPKTDSKPEPTVEPTKEKSETKSKPEKEKPYTKPETVDGEFREVKPESSTTSYDFSDTVRRLSASSEEVSKAAETGQKFWMTISNYNNGKPYFGSQSDWQGGYNRSRANENASYNEWEKEQQKTSAAQAKFIDRILNERKGERDNLNDLILGNINFRQYEKKDRKFIKDNKSYHEEAEKNGVDVTRNNDYLHQTISAGNKENIQREKEGAINRLAERLSDWRDYRDSHPGSKRAEIGISDVYADARKLGLDLNEILEKAKR